MNSGADPRPSHPLPWQAAALLPHRPPLLLVERLVARSGPCAAAEAILPMEGLFAGEEGFVAEYFIELVAQTAALGNCYDRALAGAGPGSGMIVGVDGFTWPGRAPGGSRVAVHTEVAFVFGPMKVVRGEVRLLEEPGCEIGRGGAGEESGETCRDRQGRLLATGEVKVWEEETLPPQGPAEAAAVVEHALQAADSAMAADLATAFARCSRGWLEESPAPGLRRGRLDCLFPAGFPGFAGHFPGNPILPAVLQLAAVRHGAGGLLGMAPSPLSWEKVKFKGMIRPGDPLSLSLAMAEEAGALVVDFTGKRVDGRTISSGRLRLLR